MSGGLGTAATVEVRDSTWFDRVLSWERMVSVDERLEFIAVRNWVLRSDRLSESEETLDWISVLGWIGNVGTVGTVGGALTAVDGTVGADVGLDEVGGAEAAIAAARAEEIGMEDVEDI